MRSRSGPIAGAHVELYYLPMLMSETLTDSNGAFLLCTPGQGGSGKGIDLRISKEGYTTVHRALSFGYAETDLNVELLPR